MSSSFTRQGPAEYGFVKKGPHLNPNIHKKAETEVNSLVKEENCLAVW